MEILNLRRLPLVLLLIASALAVVWIVARKSAPPQVPFTRVTRETIESSLTTNGRVEPVEWSAVRAERSGAIESVSVQKGQLVTKGAPLVSMGAAGARASLAAAEARIEQARALMATVEQGGSAADRAEVDRAINRAKLDCDAAQRDVEALERLVKQQAATGQELEAARNRLQQSQAEIRSLQHKRTALVGTSDRSVAQAQLRDAQSAAALAREEIEESIIRAPLTGTVYALDVRPGAYLNPGDLVANIGRLDRLRVIIYVDEPELGRVAAGMPVRITWDALPGRSWKGAVERIPTQVTSVGTRQVGEVPAIIENPDMSLIPGTNINAEIESQIVQDAVTMPKEAIRRQGGEVGVYVLQGNQQIAWRPVKLGVSSVTRTQVLQGLEPGAAVVLTTDIDLTSGMKVEPVFPR